MNIIYLQIKGTGSFLPEYILTNKELETMVDTSDEWISERTGIKERRLCKDTPVYDMAVKAALSAVENADITPEDIDLILATTITPDYYTPSLSCLVQKEIGATNAFCFDINAACSGFVYAMDIAENYIRTHKAKTILIVSAEALSKITDYTDRNTCVLFGDGAGAVIVGAGIDSGMVDSYLKANGVLGNVLTSSNFKDDCYIKMGGREVFKFAVSVSVETINELLSRNRLNIDDIKYIVSHQANKRIISAVASKLGCGEEKMYTNLELYGNTSSASIPICLDEMNKKNMLCKGDKIILVGFGGGLTYGGILIEWR